MTTPEHPRHRRRRRPGRAQQDAAAPAEPAADGRADRHTDDDPAARPRKAGRRSGGHGGHGGRDAMRDLTGAGHSTVGVEGALRARDVNRPTPDDLAAAEDEVELIRRHWTPPPHDG